FKAWQLINVIADLTGRKQPGAPLPQGSAAKPSDKEKNTTKQALNGNTVTNAAYLSEFCEGDETRMKKYINMYLKGVPVFLDKLKEARDAKDLKQISLRIHAFKPNWLIM